MDTFSAVSGLVVGGLVGAILVWLAARGRYATVTERLAHVQQELSDARDELKNKDELILAGKETIARLEASIEHERKNLEEKMDLLNRLKEEFRDVFKALSAEALASSNLEFLRLAKETLARFQAEAKGDLEQRQKSIENLVSPIKESLQKVGAEIQELEKARQQAYGSLSEQLRSVVTTQEQLRQETGNLVKALRAPTVRGRWGEIQLRRAVEIAGMLAHCDFVEQASISDAEARLRPDLVVNLPGGKHVVVDAKAPLQAYLEAVESDNEHDQQQRLQEHARQIRNHLKQLSTKAYWESLRPTPEFVIMFLPGESFFSAALTKDPSLIEEGVKDRVILATPTTLIALLRAVHYGWQEEKMAESVEEVRQAGLELYERICTFAEHFANLRRSLDQSVENYNKAIRSLESRVLVTARRFPELGIPKKKEIPRLKGVQKTTHTPQAPELTEEDAR